MNLGPTVAGQTTPTVRKPGTMARGTAKTVLTPGQVAREGRPVTRVPTARPAPAARPAYTPAPPPPSQGHPVLYVVLGGMAVLLVVAGAFIYFRPPGGWGNTTSSTLVAGTTPTTLPVTPPTVTTLAPVTLPQAPVTMPPIEAKGKFMRAAKAAFNRGDYDTAINEARRALAEDGSDSNAKSTIENAVNGQKAELRFRAAENALRAKDFDKAKEEANAGRDLAPWDNRAPQILTRIQEEQQRAAQDLADDKRRAAAAQAAQQLNVFIAAADSALAGQKYDEAIAGYDRALGVDPNNIRAINGKSAAVQARALTGINPGGGPARPAARGFAPGKTVASSSETKPGGSVPDGFENTPGVVVKKGSTAADLPGKINFDIDPDTPKPGERYTVKVFLVNEGNAPIQLKDMFVTTTINGKKVGAPVPPQTRDVAPQQRAVVMSTSEAWKEDTTSWQMEITIHTARGERYTNQVTWK
jgi:tetratricopeptide (TPR) repeat protein